MRIVSSLGLGERRGLGLSVYRQARGSYNPQVHFDALLRNEFLDDRFFRRMYCDQIAETPLESLRTALASMASHQARTSWAQLGKSASQSQVNSVLHADGPTAAW